MSVGARAGATTRIDGKSPDCAVSIAADRRAQIVVENRNRHAFLSTLAEPDRAAPRPWFAVERGIRSQAFHQRTRRACGFWGVCS